MLSASVSFDLATRKVSEVLIEPHATGCLIILFGSSRHNVHLISHNIFKCMIPGNACPRCFTFFRYSVG